MPKFLDRFVEKRKLNDLGPSEPEDPSAEAFAHLERMLEMSKNGTLQRPVDFENDVPIPTHFQWRNGEYWGYPLSSQVVETDQIIDYLTSHRDQSLWLSVVLGCNHDNGNTNDIFDWIVNQPDCDVQVAICAFAMLDGPYFCGKAVGDKYAETYGALRPLRTISQREAAGQHFAVGLRKDITSEVCERAADTALSRARIARNELEDDQIPLLSIPEKLLGSLNKGTIPPELYIVDEVGILVMPKVELEQMSQELN